MTSTSTSASAKSLCQLVRQEASLANIRQFLIDNKGKFDINNTNDVESGIPGVTALYQVCKAGNITLVELFLAQPDTDPNAADDTGDTPLAVACSNGYKKIVEMLLAHPKIDVNRRCINGAVRTPLLAACTQGRLAVVKLLLAHPGIDVNMNGGEGDDDIDLPLLAACENGYAKITAELLAHPGINVNVRDDYSRTALFLACDNRQLKVMKLLLARPDIDLNLADHQGTTPFNKLKLGYQRHLDYVTSPGSLTKCQHEMLTVLSADPRVIQ